MRFCGQGRSPASVPPRTQGSDPVRIAAPLRGSAWAPLADALHPDDTGNFDAETACRIPIRTCCKLASEIGRQFTLRQLIERRTLSSSRTRRAIQAKPGREVGVRRVLHGSQMLCRQLTVSGAAELCEDEGNSDRVDYPERCLALASERAALCASSLTVAVGERP